MRIAIVYDNEALDGFKKDWGFSCLIEEHVLFDTGADYHRLLSNMQKLNIRLKEIDTLVLSHAHGDHTGGIRIVEQLDDVRVFVPTSFFLPMKKALSRFDNAEVVEVSSPTKVVERIRSTGEIAQMEQSLFVQTEKGLVVVTGCSHPGLDTIMNMAGQYGTIYGVVGGFHGFSKFEYLQSLKMIVPCHCTRQKDLIHTKFPKTSKHCAAGAVFDV